MANVIAGMTVSLDGFVEDADGDSGPLYTDLEAWRQTDHMARLIERTGAVVLGRRSFDMAGDPDWYAGNYEFQVPIFVLTHRPPQKMPRETDQLRFEFVTDGVEAAVERARAAAGEKDVQVIGPSVVRQVLQAGLADELAVDVMPVLLGGGLPFLEGLGPTSPELEKLGVEEVGPRTSLRFRVASGDPS